MLEKIKSYLRFWNKKPSYHLKGSKYGGFRLDIDQYYEKQENQKKLKEINKSKFPEIIQKEEHSRELQPD